jgi:prevent-host-death family protein
MRVVGVKALKARLSEYLRAVRQGDVVLVTDRDEVIAELRPATGKVPPEEVLDDRLNRLAAAGEVTLSSGPSEGWRWTASGLGLAAGTSEQVLDELRGER